MGKCTQKILIEGEGESMNKKIVYYGIIILLIVVGIFGSMKIEKYEKAKKVVTSKNEGQNSKLDIEMEYSSSSSIRNKEEKMSKKITDENSTKSVEELPVMNLNEATYLDIRSRGFSSNIAQRIVYFRELHGGIANWEALDSIQGIGEKSIEKIKLKFTLTPISVKPMKFSLSDMNDNLLSAMGIPRKSVKIILEYKDKNGKISMRELESFLSEKQVDQIKEYFNE